MKKYVYELIFQQDGMIADYRTQIGFFSSLREIRTYITEDGSPRDSFKAVRYELNPTHEEKEPVFVDIKWET